MIPYYTGPLMFDCPPENSRIKLLTHRLSFNDSLGRRKTAPKGLETDGASVGKILCLPIIGWLVRMVLAGDQFTGPFLWPSIVHDAEYGLATESSFWAALMSPVRAEADRRFFEGALCSDVVMPKLQLVKSREIAPWWRAAVVYLVLRIFGWAAWMDDSSRAQRSQWAMGNEPN